MPYAHLLGSEQAPGSQTVVTALQVERLPDMRNLLQVERLVLPSSPSLPIQNFRDLTITVAMQERVDFGDHFRFCLPNLSDGQWLGQPESSSGTTAETHMDLNHLCVD